VRPKGLSLRKIEKLMRTHRALGQRDRERYRYNPPREFTADEQRRMDAIKRAFDEVHPTLEKLNRLDS
jgi:hypothetical protein